MATCKPSPGELCSAAVSACTACMPQPRGIHRKPPAWLVLAAFLFAVNPAPAHTLPISYLYLVPDTDYLHLELVINPFELSFFSELDQNHDGQLQPPELEARQEVVARQILGCIKLKVGTRTLVPETAGVTPDLDSHHLTLRAHYRLAARRVPLMVQSTLADITSGSHVTQVTWLHGGQKQLAQLEMRSNYVTFQPLENNPPSPSPTEWRQVRLSLILVLLLVLSMGEIAGFALVLWRMRRRILRYQTAGGPTA